MLTKTPKVNTAICLAGRLDPQSAATARILILTDQWLKGTYGVTTGAKAAAIAGCSLPLIDAARVVLQSNDGMLLAQVLDGQLSLTAAASKMRRRVRLIETFKAASPADRAALGLLDDAVDVFDSWLAAGHKHEASASIDTWNAAVA